MEINDLIYRNFMMLCRKYNADTPNKLKVVLNCTKQHASALLNKVSPIGKSTMKKLADAWDISPDDFYKNEQSNKSKAESSPEERISALEKRFDSYERSTNLTLDLTKMGLESLKDSAKYLQGALESIDNRLEKAGDSGDVRLLRRAG